MGPTGVHGGSPRAASASPSGPCPSKGRWREALPPQGPIWAAGTAPQDSTNSRIRVSGGTCASLQIPRSQCVLRPRGATQSTSVKTQPARATAYFARCWKCQSFAIPSRARYISMGETTTRLGKRTPRSSNGEKSADVGRESVTVRSSSRGRSAPTDSSSKADRRAGNPRMAGSPPPGRREGTAVRRYPPHGAQASMAARKRSFASAPRAKGLMMGRSSPESR